VNAASAHRVVIVGGGFGGLAAAQGLKGTGVRITIVDQRNHHLFQPLLYQVGTATLATSEIAWPIRQLFRKRKDITTLLGTAAGVDAEAREVLLEDGGGSVTTRSCSRPAHATPISATTNGSPMPRP
jgi:NADH dehydrogenase